MCVVIRGLDTTIHRDYSVNVYCIVGTVVFYRSIISILQHLHLEFVSLINFKRFLIFSVIKEPNVSCSNFP